MTPILRKAAPWAFFALVVFWTWGPVRFRPSFGHPNLERFAAFFVLAALTALIYRFRRWLLGFAIAAAAIILEVGQQFIPGRDARVSDAMVKVAGAVIGVVLIAILQSLTRHSGALRAPSPSST